MYFQMFTQMKKELGQLDKWLAAAEADAQARKFDPNVFLTVRLAPDQFPLVRQVQSTCDTAKLGAARLTGKDAPSHPDTEASLPELRARVHAEPQWLERAKLTLRKVALFCDWLRAEAGVATAPKRAAG